MPNVSCLVTTAYDAKIGKVENKIPNVSALVTSTVFNTKMEEIESKIPYHDNISLLLNLNNFLKKHLRKY